MGQPIEFEWDGKEGSGYTVLPKGTYVVQIDALEPGTAKNGNPRLAVKGRVCFHPQYDQQKVTIFYSALPQSGWKLVRFLDACGVDFEQFEQALPNGEQGVKVRFDGDDVLGAYVQYQVSVSKNPNTDKDKNDFENEEAYNPDGGQQTQAPPTQVQGPNGQQYQAYPQHVQQPQQQPQQPQTQTQMQPPPATGRRRRGTQVQG